MHHLLCHALWTDVKMYLKQTFCICGAFGKLKEEILPAAVAMRCNISRNMHFIQFAHL